MRHASVFVGRQYAAFAGITHGQKVHNFLEMLLVRRFVRSIELGTTGRTRIFHLHYPQRSAERIPTGEDMQRRFGEVQVRDDDLISPAQRARMQGDWAAADETPQ